MCVCVWCVCVCGVCVCVCVCARISVCMCMRECVISIVKYLDYKGTAYCMRQLARVFKIVNTILQQKTYTHCFHQCSTSLYVNNISMIL